MKINPSIPPGTVEHDTTTEHRMNEERQTETLLVENTGDHIIQVGSHYHFFEANPALKFDRRRAYGKHLDIPPGDRIHFPPVQPIEVTLISFGGDETVRGFYDVVNGRIDEHTPEAALERLKTRVFEPLADPSWGGDDD